MLHIDVEVGGISIIYKLAKRVSMVCTENPRISLQLLYEIMSIRLDIPVSSFHFRFAGSFPFWMLLCSVLRLFHVFLLSVKVSIPCA